MRIFQISHLRHLAFISLSSDSLNTGIATSRSGTLLQQNIPFIAIILTVATQ